MCNYLLVLQCPSAILFQRSPCKCFSAPVQFCFSAHTPAKLMQLPHPASPSVPQRNLCLSAHISAQPMHPPCLASASVPRFSLPQHSNTCRAFALMLVHLPASAPAAHGLNTTHAAHDTHTNSVHVWDQKACSKSSMSTQIETGCCSLLQQPTPFAQLSYTYQQPACHSVNSTSHTRFCDD
eukprot:625095-Pelagomonas_calceolata.AAC.1